MSFAGNPRAIQEMHAESAELTAMSWPVGEWKNEENLLVLAEDGSFAADLSGEQFRGRWRLEGDCLWLGGASFRLTRIDATLWLDNRPFQPVERAPAPDSKEKERWVPEKLVGTWGYLGGGPVVGGGYHKSRVLTLNRDGTYRMESDAYSSGMFGQVSSTHTEEGQWWVEGSRMWFEGEQGCGSRELDLRNHPRTGDPMIVMDGDAYVTRRRRPAW